MTVFHSALRRVSLGYSGHPGFSGFQFLFFPTRIALSLLVLGFNSASIPVKKTASNSAITRRNRKISPAVIAPLNQSQCSSHWCLVLWLRSFLADRRVWQWGHRIWIHALPLRFV